MGCEGGKNRRGRPKKLWLEALEIKALRTGRDWQEI